MNYPGEGVTATFASVPSSPLPPSDSRQGNISVTIPSGAPVVAATVPSPYASPHATEPNNTAATTDDSPQVNTANGGMGGSTASVGRGGEKMISGIVAVVVGAVSVFGL